MFGAGPESEVYIVGQITARGTERGLEGVVVDMITVFINVC